MAVLLLALAATTQAAIPADERQALLDLYASTNGPLWTNNTKWNDPPGTECTWTGVICNTDGTTVVQLVLQDNHLVGTLPSSLRSLHNLELLHLSNNQLTGGIPTTLGGLSKLRNMWLWANQLSGSIPSQLGNLSSLQGLCLEDNSLTGSIPSQLGNLANLEDLRLTGNQLTGSIPPQLGNLARLKILYLYWNQLSGEIPPELGNLGNLEILDLSDNSISGSIPPQLGNLAKLKILELSFNPLSGSIPRELGNLGSLEHLWLFADQLTGSIPPELGTLASLRGLYLPGNQLSGGIPPELGSLANLEILHLVQNQLSGGIPPELGNLANLRTLWMDSNHLTGEIPPEIGNLANLRNLGLRYNQLVGSIPPEIGNLPAIVDLALSSNQLVGSLPVTLLNLTTLNGYVDLRWNGVYTDDDALRAFLNARQTGGDWESSQTIAPTGLATGSPSFNTITVSWTPIAFTGETGGYRVWARSDPDGTYQPMGMTLDKAASSLVVSGLDPATTYSFQVQTITNPHSNNANTVASELSEAVDGTTVGDLGPVSSDVDTHGGGDLVSDLNGVLEPGETVDVSPIWRNIDTVPHAVGGAASTFTGPDGATYAIPDPAAGFGTVAPGATANCHDATGNCYALSVSDPAVRPATHWDAQWLETLSTGETKTWTLHIGDSFADVPRTHWAYRFVETILHNRVTAGCDTGAYCPASPLTRAEMAVLLLIAEHGFGWTPSPATGGIFTDVPIGHWAGSFIETLAAEGITSGCGVGLYCPDNPITRAEMAVFLLLAEHGSGWTPPLSSGTVFTDVPVDHWAGDFVEQLAAEGITGGCDVGLYCPDSPVTRAEMAVFLTATFDLKLY